MKTEKCIKLLLTLLYKAVIRWYKEHPEGRKDMAKEIDCYGSAVIGVRDHGEGAEGIASLTVYTAKGYLDINAPICGKKVSL